MSAPKWHLASEDKPEPMTPVHICTGFGKGIGYYAGEEYWHWLPDGRTPESLNEAEQCGLLTIVFAWRPLEAV